MLTHGVVRERDTVDDGDDDSSSSVGRDDVYKGRAEPVLVLLSNSYSKEEILVCDSKPSSCPAYTFYLLLLSDYCPNKFYIILS